MKSKKFVSGLLAGAMVLTSVFTTGWTEAEAAEEDPAEDAENDEI